MEKSNDKSKRADISVTVDAILYTIGEEESENYRKLSEKKLQVLLVKRGAEPYKDKWSFPGTFIKEEESLEEGVKRCLEQKANAKNVYLEQLYTWGAPNRDPRGRVLSTAYMGLIDKSSIKVHPGTNIEEIAWFSIKTNLINKKIKQGKNHKSEEEIEIVLENDIEKIKCLVVVTKELVNGNLIIYTSIKKSDLAFDHAKMLIYSIERLKNKIEYTTIVFNLMPEKFTLSALQQVYEILLDKKLLKASFRRKIEDMVIETEKYDSNAGHRPSKLYVFNTEYQAHKF
jgi:ADP-ribose pyrophosphatase YjhB (NUDIX family)